MKFHFDSYVKNWKRKRVEPEKKKLKLDLVGESDSIVTPEAESKTNDDSESDEESIKEKLAESEPGKSLYQVKFTKNLYKDNKYNISFCRKYYGMPKFSFQDHVIAY